jgi:hypothetical protein
MQTITKAEWALRDEVGASEALDLICAVEGIERSSLISVTVIDREISVRYARSTGSTRTSTYPMVALAMLMSSSPVHPHRLSL